MADNEQAKPTYFISKAKILKMSIQETEKSIIALLKDKDGLTAQQILNGLNLPPESFYIVDSALFSLWCSSEIIEKKSLTTFQSFYYVTN